MEFRRTSADQAVIRLGLLLLCFTAVDVQGDTSHQINSLLNRQSDQGEGFDDFKDEIPQPDVPLNKNETISLSRTRRDSPGTQAHHVVVTLTETPTSTPMTQVGHTWLYTLKIDFPTIVNMSATVELNTLDIISGQTTMTIVNFRVTSVGSGLSSNLGDFTQLPLQWFHNLQQKRSVDRLLIDLGEITNVDTVDSGTTDASSLVFVFKVLQFGNPDIKVTLTDQVIAASVEFTSHGLVWTSVSTVSGPDPPFAQTTRIESTAQPTANSLQKYSAHFFTYSAKISARRAVLLIETFLVTGSEEGVASLGGINLKCGARFFNLIEFNTKNGSFEGDAMQTYIQKSKKGKSTVYKLYKALILQGLTDGPTEEQIIDITVPVYVTGQAEIGSPLSLHVNLELQKELTKSLVIPRQEYAAQKFTVLSGTEPAPSGTISIQGSKLASVDGKVASGGIILYDVTLQIPSDSYITTHTLTMGLSAVPGVTLSDVQIYSQGSNIVYVETGDIDENEGSFILSKIQTANMAAQFGEKSNLLVLRFFLKVTTVQALTLNPGDHSLPAYRFLEVSGNMTSDVILDVTGEIYPAEINLGQHFAVDLSVNVPSVQRTTDLFTLMAANNPTKPFNIQLCGIHVQRVGKDLPSFESVESQKHNDTNLSSSFTVEPSTVTQFSEVEDRTIILRVVGRMMPTQTQTGNFDPVVALTVSSSKISVSINSFALRPENNAYTGDDPILTILDRGNVTITHGKTHFLRVSLIIPKGARSPGFSLNATTDGGIRVNRVVLLKIGKNHACLNKELVEITPGDNVVGPSYERQPPVSSTIHLGHLSGLGSNNDRMSKSDPELFDEEQILLGVAVQSFSVDPPVGDVSSSITITPMKDPSQAIPTLHAIKVTASGSPIQTTANPADFTLHLEPVGSNLIILNSASVIKAHFTVPVDFYGNMKLKCSRRTKQPKKWTVEKVLVYGSGENVFGVWRNSLTSSRETTTAPGINVTDSLTLNIVHITQKDVVEPSSTTKNYTEANTVRCLCVVKAMADTDLANDETISIGVELLDTNDQMLKLDSADLTFTDTRPIDETDFDNSTVELVVLGEPYNAVIGQTIDVALQIKLPQGEHNVKALALGESSSNRTKIRLINAAVGGNPGSSIINLPMDLAGRVNRSKNNTNIASPLDTDSVKVDLGHIWNIDDKVVGDLSDQKFELVFTIQVADHPEHRQVANPTSYLHVSMGIRGLIITDKVPISITHANDDQAIIETALLLKQPEKLMYDYRSDQKVGFSLEIRHTNESKREAEDARVVVMFPPYIVFENESATSDSATLEVLHKGSSVALVVGRLLLVDSVTVNFSAWIDPNSVRPPGSGWVKATTLARPICRPSLQSAGFERCGPVSFVSYRVNSPGCSSPLLASLDSCHFSASSVIEANSHGAEEVKLSRPGWRPAVRNTNHGEGQFVEVDFGRNCLVSGWQVTSTAGSNQVTEISLLKMILSKTFVPVTKASVSANMPQQILEESFDSQKVRIVIETTSNDTSRYTELRAELYGCCHGEIQEAFNCSGPSTAVVYSDRPYKWRHFAVDPVNNNIYFCDYHWERNRVFCFSAPTINATTWTALPPYAASLRGRSNAGMYIYDHSLKNTLVSTDGVAWTVVDDSTDLSGLVEPSVLPGRLKADTTPLQVDGWTGDYHGLKKDGVYYVRWD